MADRLLPRYRRHFFDEKSQVILTHAGITISLIVENIKRGEQNYGNQATEVCQRQEAPNGINVAQDDRGIRGDRFDNQILGRILFLSCRLHKVLPPGKYETDE